MADSQTILIAEDDPVFQHLLQFTLQRAGYEVVATFNGEDAWQRWLTGGIDLLMIDQQMPHCSGLELIERITRSRVGQCPSMTIQANILPIILCTAKGLELDRKKLSQQYGLLDVISKPFSPKQLVRRIDEALRSSSIDAPAKVTSLFPVAHRATNLATPLANAWHIG